MTSNKSNVAQKMVVKIGYYNMVTPIARHGNALVRHGNALKE